MISIKNIELPLDWIFQQLMRKWFHENNVNVLEWQSQSVPRSEPNREYVALLENSNQIASSNKHPGS